MSSYNKVDKKKMVFIILGVIALGFLFFQMNKPKTSENPNETFLTVTFYDKQGNIVDNKNTLSIVNNIEGVYKLSFTISVTNTGSENIVCDLYNLTDTDTGTPKGNGQFNSSFTNRTTKIIAPTKNMAWTGNLIDTGYFEDAPLTDIFNATIKCQYTLGPDTIIFYKSGSLLLTVEPETANADFNLFVIRGGIPSTWCGDNICQPNDEDCPTCWNDPCGPQNTVCSANISFRTNDLSYPTGGAIAWNNNTCGSILVRYGYAGDTCVPVTNPTCPTIGSRTLIKSGVPMNINWANNTLGGCLYKYDTDPLRIAVAFKSITTHSPCSVSGQWVSIYYNSDDSDRTKVSDITYSINRTMELPC